MASSSTSPQLSASVTRILSLSHFPSELKTRDLISAFADWEADKGGFKVKWVDDTHAQLVFQDAGVAKKAYLQTLLHPHPSLSSQVVIRPYDGPDAQSIIGSVNARTGVPGAPVHNNPGGHSAGPSLSMNGQRRGHGGGGSISSMGAFVLPSNPNAQQNPSPPLAHARNPSAGGGGQGFSDHTRMGSFGSGQASWNQQPPGSGARRESSGAGAGGAEAALNEVRRALASASLRNGSGVGVN